MERSKVLNFADDGATLGDLMKSLSFLRTALDSFSGYVSDSGEVIDPVLGEPTQYGTPYHAFGQAVLAAHSEGAERDTRLAKALLSFRAAAGHVAHPARRPNASSVSGPEGAVGAMNHRDFFWPPLMKTFRLLRDLGTENIGELRSLLAGVDPDRVFAAQPPGNWASVWMSGEWIRLREGFSPLSREDFDERLGVFFEPHILLEQGFFQEPGHSNSYDLFTRYHLADLLGEGYDGRHRDYLHRLLRSGLRRSLGVQLSDGSMASAHRSTGQTWTIGCQCAFFTLAAGLLEAEDPALADEARRAANLAFASLVRWQRPGGVFSPVENLLPPEFRVGYEVYSADAHYGNLPLGFLGAAILRGFRGEEPSPGKISVHVDNDPVWRGVVRAGRYSAQLNGFPHPDFDALGLTDVTFGPGRYLHFVSPVLHEASGTRLAPGLAARPEAGRSALLCEKLSRKEQTLSAHPFALPCGGITQTGPAALRLETQISGYSFRQVFEVSADAEQGVLYRQGFPGRRGRLSWLLPYVRDIGGGRQTTVQIERGPESCTVRLQNGEEEVEVVLEARVESVLHLGHGYQSRRGLCGLVRLDLADAAEEAGCRFRILR